jgi:hypothetical protein
MYDVVKDMFDGEQVQDSIAVCWNARYRSTMLSLIAMRDGAFVVVTGIDVPGDGSQPKRKPFSDQDISNIFDVFNKTVDDSPNLSADELYQAIVKAIGDDWVECPPCGTCPFNVGIVKSTRIVFHMHIPGWSFEDARLKFKSDLPSGQFSDLQWLSLDGKSMKPMSFSLTDQDTKAGVFQFSLYMRAESGQTWTRIIIDPDNTNTGVGP